MGHDMVQTGLADLQGDGFGAKRSLSACTPDIDAPGVDHQQPGVATAQSLADRVEGQLVVCRHHHRSVRSGSAYSIQTGIDGVGVAAKAQAGTAVAQAIPKRGTGSDAGNSPRRCGDESVHIGLDAIAGQVVGPCTRGRRRTSAGGGA